MVCLSESRIIYNRYRLLKYGYTNVLIMEAKISVNLHDGTTTNPTLCRAKGSEFLKAFLKIVYIAFKALLYNFLAFA